MNTATRLFHGKSQGPTKTHILTRGPKVVGPQRTEEDRTTTELLEKQELHSVLILFDFFSLFSTKGQRFFAAVCRGFLFGGCSLCH